MAMQPADSNDIPAMDWHGAAIDAARCAGCEHAALRAAGQCEPGRCCMHDVYARRIDRFFRTHPSLANQHLTHEYFEVRAIAARYADVFRLGAMLVDPDETVRLQVALRVPQRLLLKLRDDPHREVRIRVALRLDLPELAALVRDTDYQVRCIVAKRAPEGLLPLLMHDADLQVRQEVARRLPMPALWRMAADAAPEVRRIVAERLPVSLLDALAADADWTVRWEAAGRATGAALERLRDDAEPEVRERARERAMEVSEWLTSRATTTSSRSPTRRAS
ncbi:MAG: 4Fe4S-binding leucine-rich repeat protein [Piscinibacter sp.]